MATIEEMIKNSSCFGLAYDGTVRECKICEVKLKCESKCRLGVTKPEQVDVADTSEITEKDTKKTASAAKKPAVKAKEAAKKPAVQYADDMPDFKSLSMEELESLAGERGIDLAEFQKYSAANIKRMRMTMALKKTYEK